MATDMLEKAASPSLATFELGEIKDFQMDFSSDPWDKAGVTTTTIRSQVDSLKITVQHGEDVLTTTFGPCDVHVLPLGPGVMEIAKR